MKSYKGTQRTKQHALRPSTPAPDQTLDLELQVGFHGFQSTSPAEVTSPKQGSAEQRLLDSPTSVQGRATEPPAPAHPHDTASPSPALSLLPKRCSQTPPRAAGHPLQCVPSGSLQGEGCGSQNYKGCLLCSRMTKLRVRYSRAQLTSTSHFSDAPHRSDQTQIKTRNNLKYCSVLLLCTSLSDVPYCYK